MAYKTPSKITHVHIDLTTPKSLNFCFLLNMDISIPMQFWQQLVQLHSRHTPVYSSTSACRNNDIVHSSVDAGGDQGKAGGGNRGDLFWPDLW